MRVRVRPPSEPGQPGTGWWRRGARELPGRGVCAVGPLSSRHEARTEPQKGHRAAAPPPARSRHWRKRLRAAAPTRRVFLRSARRCPCRRRRWHMNRLPGSELPTATCTGPAGALARARAHTHRVYSAWILF